jgi:hypothetical protein
MLKKLLLFIPLPIFACGPNLLTWSALFVFLKIGLSIYFVYFLFLSVVSLIYSAMLLIRKKSKRGSLYSFILGGILIVGVVYFYHEIINILLFLGIYLFEIINSFSF